MIDILDTTINILLTLFMMLSAVGLGILITLFCKYYLFK